MITRFRNETYPDGLPTVNANKTYYHDYQLATNISKELADIIPTISSKLWQQHKEKLEEKTLNKEIGVMLEKSKQEQANEDVEKQLAQESQIDASSIQDLIKDG
eukprot:6702711-Ditylum_brightwellii.AAC.1